MANIIVKGFDEIPRIGTTDINAGIPEDDPLYGEYTREGVCEVCGAPRLINHTAAMKANAGRPQLIYTCEDRTCPGRLTLEPYWQPKFFNIPFINGAA